MFWEKTKETLNGTGGRHRSGFQESTAARLYIHWKGHSMFSIAADNGKTSKLANKKEKIMFHFHFHHRRHDHHCAECNLNHQSKINLDLSQKNEFHTLHQFQSSSRKSAILSAAKKAKLKSNPSRVGEISLSWGWWLVQEMKLVIFILRIMMLTLTKIKTSHWWEKWQRKRKNVVILVIVLLCW